MVQPRIVSGSPCGASGGIPVSGTSPLMIKDLQHWLSVAVKDSPALAVALDALGLDEEEKGLSIWSTVDLLKELMADLPPSASAESCRRIILGAAKVLTLLVEPEQLSTASPVDKC